MPYFFSNCLSCFEDKQKNKKTRKEKEGEGGKQKKNNLGCTFQTLKAISTKIVFDLQFKYTDVTLT